MKAIVVDGQFIRTEPDNAVTDPDSTYAWVDLDPPPVLAGEVAVAGVTIDEVQRTVTRTWTVRNKTADELRKKWTCLEFIARLTPDEIAGLWTYAPQLMALLLSSHEVESDNELTLFGLNQAVAAGLITEARKEQLLA